MNFISKLVGEIGEGQQEANYPQNQGYGSGYGNNQGYGSGYGNNQGPPRVSYPWETEWDDSRGTWIFINRETGQRTHEYPGQSYGGGGGMGAFEQAGAGGLAGYEGQRVENDYDREKYRVENDVYNAPENAARWGGEKVQEVEDIPQDVDNWGRRKVNEVENIPEDVAGWTGHKVQQVEDIPEDIGHGFEEVVDAPRRWFDRKEDEVERFDNRVENSYDQGENQQQYRDDNRYDRYDRDDRDDRYDRY